MRQDHSIFLPDTVEDRSQPPTTVIFETDDHHSPNPERHPREAGLRHVNYRFLILTATTLVVLLSFVEGLHRYQIERLSSHLLKRADDALAVGQLDNAIPHLRGYLLMEPDDRETRQKLAVALADVAKSAKQRYEAFLFLEQVLKDDPTQSELRRRLIDLLMSGGRFPDAIEHLKMLIANAPSDDQLHLLMARSYAAVGENLRAVGFYENAIRCAPRSLSTYEELAELLHERMNEEEKASQVIDQMVASRLSSYEVYLARARFNQRHGKVASTESDALYALQVGPEVPEVLEFVAGLIASWGDRDNKFNVDQVLAGLIRALDQNSSDVGLLVAIAQLDAHRGRYDLAEQRLRTAIQGGSEDLQLGWRLAEMMIAQSKVVEARIEIARLRELKLAKPLEQYLLARIAMVEGHWLEAIQKFESVRSAGAVSTLMPQINLCLGSCYENLGHVEQQLAAYREATKLNESSVAARLGLARSLARIGRISDALEHYGQVWQLAGVETQMARLMILRNLKLQASERNWDEVEKVLDAAARADLENSLVVRSFMLVARDQGAQALELLERGIERHPGHVGMRVALAETHFQMGNIAQAESVILTAEQTLGNRVEILLTRIRYASALKGDAAQARLSELEESAQNFSGVAQLNVWRALAAAAAALGDIDRWKRHLEAVAKKSPDDLEVIQSLYSAALQTASTDEVERWLQEIRRIQGNDGPETMLAEAQRLLMVADQRVATYKISGDQGAVVNAEADKETFEQARELLKKVTVRMPGSPRVALGLAHVESLAGNEELAIDYYSQAIDFGETNPDVFNRLIRILYKRSRYAEAADVVERLRNSATVSLTGELGRVAAEVSIGSKDLEQASWFAELAVSSESPDYRDHLWRGQILWAAGQSERAELCLRRAIALAPERNEPWIALIQFLGRNGRTDEALQEMNNLRGRLSDEDASYTLGQCYQALNQTQQAEQQYELALQARPDNEQVLWALAQLYLNKARWPEAEVLLRRLIALNSSASVAAASARRAAAMVLTMQHGYPGYKEGLALLEQNLANEGGTTADRRMKAMLLGTRPSRSLRREAVAILERLDENNQQTPEDQISLIRLYMAQDDVDQARPYMTALLQSRGNNPEFLALCVRMLLQHDDASDTVMVWLEKLEQLQPDQFRTIELRARVLAAQNKVDEAVTMLRELASRPSADPEQGDLQIGQVAAVLADLASAFDRSGRQQNAKPLATAAEEMYREVAARKPERTIDLVRFLGSSLQLEEAFALCESTWQSAPPQVVAATYVELLRAREATPEQLQQVQRLIQAALQRDPESSDLLFQLGNVVHLAGNYAEAETLYRRAIQNTSQPTLTMLASNELALLLALHRHETDEAIQLMNQAIDMNGPLSFLLDTRATIYLAAGDTGGAIRDLEQAIADTPSAANKFHLAQARLLSGDTVSAVTAWRESMSLGLHLKGIHPLERSVFEELNSKLK